MMKIREVRNDVGNESLLVRSIGRAVIARLRDLCNYYYAPPRINLGKRNAESGFFFFFIYILRSEKSRIDEALENLLDSDI